MLTLHTLIARAFLYRYSSSSFKLAAAPTLAPTTAAPTTAAPSTAKPTTEAPVTAKPTTATVAVKISGPYNGVASQIPGTVSADWFDTGGPNVAYSGMWQLHDYYLCYTLYYYCTTLSPMLFMTDG
jgi:hypothetical protein